MKEGGNFALKYAAGPRKDKCGKRRLWLALLEVLLNCPSIDVNNKDDEGITAFMWACINGRQEVVERMSSFPGLDINHRDRYGGNSAFMLAVKHKLVEIVDFFLRL